MRRVLLIDDDVVSGILLELALNLLHGYQPGRVSLYLGRAEESQYSKALALGSSTCASLKTTLTPQVAISEKSSLPKRLRT